MLDSPGVGPTSGPRSGCDRCERDRSLVWGGSPSVVARWVGWLVAFVGGKHGGVGGKAVVGWVRNVQIPGPESPGHRPSVSAPS